MKSKQEAKAIFLEYGASSFGLFREGVYEEYKTFNVSKKEEMCWRDEAFMDKMEEVYKSEEQDALQMCLIEQNHLILNIAPKKKYILLLKKEIEENMGKFNDFTKVIAAEMILKALTYVVFHYKLKRNVRSLGNLLLQSAWKNLQSQGIKKEADCKLLERIARDVQEYHPGIKPDDGQ